MRSISASKEIGHRLASILSKVGSPHFAYISPTCCRGSINTVQPLPLGISQRWLPTHKKHHTHTIASRRSFDPNRQRDRLVRQRLGPTAPPRSDKVDLQQPLLESLSVSAQAGVYPGNPCLTIAIAAQFYATPSSWNKLGLEIETPVCYLLCLT